MWEFYSQSAHPLPFLAILGTIPCKNFFSITWLVLFVSEAHHEPRQITWTKCHNFIANWLIKIFHTGKDFKKKEILNSIVKAVLPFLPIPLTKTTSLSTESNETLILFLVQILFLNTFTYNKLQNINIETTDCKSLKRKFGIKF